MMRIGCGFDVHAFADGGAGDDARRLILGGVDIPYAQGLAGHSDADVLTHAICDALLGALALGDIGQVFPDDDPAYKDISSLVLLRRVVDKVDSSGARIVNIDATVALQQPKLAPYIAAMRDALSECMKIKAEQVSVKATTTERLGFVGRGEGAAAFAVALLQTADGAA